VLSFVGHHFLQSLHCHSLWWEPSGLFTHFRMALQHLISASRTSRIVLTRTRVGLASLSSTRTIKTPAYEGHIPLNWAENAFLAVGSAVMSLMDPRRGGMHLLIHLYVNYKLTFSRHDCSLGRNNGREIVVSSTRANVAKSRRTKGIEGAS
jgi:hypothetical protein